ncbi:hypothetical protein RJ55_01140 [Drechmeria coniospora]|nr:hypothetical protein RJ55_01140 [Drechmeria coniospora]
MLSLRLSLLFSAAVLGTLGSGRKVPSNVQSFYHGIRARQRCNEVLAGGFHASHGDTRGSGTFDYCGDHMDDYGVLYLQGRDGALADMDIDCDGVQNGPADDHRCRSSADIQAITAFAETVRRYGTGQPDLDPNAHAYVVLGNDGTKPGWKTFDPRNHGIEPLSVVAVVCKDKLFFAVWGDTNGDDGPQAVVGEASIALATACFGQAMNGNAGHGDADVLYIAFRGHEAVPGADGAKWNAQNFDEFESSIADLGDRLVTRIGDGGANQSTCEPSPTPAGRCSWEGHCAGAFCNSEHDCSDDLICETGKCSAPVY